MEGIASEHLQINTVLKGNVWDVDLTKDVTGVYLIYEVTNIAPNGFNGIDYSLDVFLCDNVTEINTATNEVSVQNECSLIALDMMSIFENYNKTSWADKDLNLVLNKTWSIQPFTERFDSLYSGAAVNVSLSTSYGYARCQVPTKDPKNVSAPIVSGITWRGENLTTTDGVWEGTGVITFAYQWLRNGLEISGANENVYTLVAEDDYTFVSCLVTAIDATGQAVKLSNSVGEVLGLPRILTNPILSGTEIIGETLSVTDGTWEGKPTITFSYQWRRDLANIGGATSNNYELADADYQTNIDCVVTATNDTGSVSQDSNDSGLIEGIIPSIIGVPTFSGVEYVGKTLTAISATTEGRPTPTRVLQWQRSDNGLSGWADIIGENSNTYILTDSDNNKFVRVSQTETNDLGVATANSVSSGEIINFGEVTFAAYSVRVTEDEGLVENDTCTIEFLESIG